MKTRFFLLSILIVFPVQALPASISSATASMEKRDGFLPVYWDPSAGKLYLEIDRWDEEILYVNALATGIGSNDIGLDRGQLGSGRIVLFRRIGPKVLLLQPNYGYRAVTNNPDERRSVEEAFAQSVLWGFTVAAGEGTRALVDATDFFLRDVHDVAGSLKESKQGNYSPDVSRSTLLPEQIKNFPLNLEVEALLTFTGSEPGNWVRQVVPTPGAITVRQHHSFVQLPEPGYVPRAFDPRSGFIYTAYHDYAAPIDQPLVKRLITRHRLAKKDPGAARSEAVEPIVYYLDRGAPEPVRSALLDGARWWNEAFEAAGYIDAFRVEMLPENADPLDLRYNVIQWVHRATRGWSYGSFIEDPRTGEILKGHVSLGSLRVRQDFLIAEGLVADYAAGKPTDPALLEMALARIRQLSAHEVGHTIGLMHNFVASTAERASVMDYPHPYVQIRNDSTLDLSQAYATGIGEWDKVAVTYGYQDFPEGMDEAAALGAVLTDAARRGLVSLTDQDARPRGSAHPEAHLWDNGRNAAAELDRVMAVRAIGLRSFSERRIRPGTPLAMLEDALVPLYFSHRYQVEAAVKVIGGLRYSYAVRGDGQKPVGMVSPAEQRAALESVLATLDPSALAIPESILDIIPPRPAGFPSGREHLKGNTAMTLDPAAAAGAAAHHSVSLLLNPDRAARLVEYHSRSESQPGFDEVVGALMNRTWYADRGSGYHGQIARSIDMSVLYALLTLAGDASASPEVRGTALLHLRGLHEWLSDQIGSANPQTEAHYLVAADAIGRFGENPAEISLPKPATAPDGPPIGAWGCGSDSDDVSTRWEAP